MRHIKIDRKFDGVFSIMDYQISHSQLLLRSSKFENDINVNLDIRFEMVTYIELQDNIEDIHLSNADENDWEYLRTKYSGPISKEYQQLYRIMANNKRYFILASSCVIEENNLLPLVSSLKGSGT